jgi:hypothetical protein
MPANNTPIFSVAGTVTKDGATGLGQPITLAANDFTGAGANNVLVFTAGTFGSFVEGLRFTPNGTNVASVARIFINNGAANTTAANNTYIGDLALPATTANAAGITGPVLFFPLGFVIDQAFKIYVGLGTAVAAGWSVTPMAGKY